MEGEITGRKSCSSCGWGGDLSGSVCPRCGRSTLQSASPQLEVHVEHYKYGRGKIITSRNGGFEIYVHFDTLGSGLWVRMDDVKKFDNMPSPKERPAPPPSNPIGDTNQCRKCGTRVPNFLLKSGLCYECEQAEAPKVDTVKPKLKKISAKSDFKPFVREKLELDQHTAREIIESLRMGIVPHTHVEHLTFGRDEELGRINSWLDKNSSDGTLAILGEYGIGKSHLVEYVYSKAIHNDWAVSLIELDPSEIALNHPKKIYESIVKNFRFREKDGDFRHFLDELARHPHSTFIKRHHYLWRVISHLQSYNMANAAAHGGNLRLMYEENLLSSLMEWIEGEETNYKGPNMFPYQNASNIYSYILSGIGWAAKEILGMNGFLIVFDEAEKIERQWYGTYGYRALWNNLDGMVMMANNDKRLAKESEELLIRRRTWREGDLTREGFRGDLSGLHYCRPLAKIYGGEFVPFMWKSPSNVKMLFSFTPEPSVTEKEPIQSMERIELDEIGDEAKEELNRVICEIYRMAYNSVDIGHINLSHAHIRSYIKGIVEANDLKRFYPDMSLDELLS